MSISSSCSSATIGGDENFGIITSLRSDHSNLSSLGERFYMLSFHLDRMVAACKAFGRDSKIFGGRWGLIHLEMRLFDLMGTLDGPDRDPLKLRVEITKAEKLRITSSPVPRIQVTSLFPSDLNKIDALPETSYQIFISPKPTKPSLFTVHKTTNRGHYDEQRSLIPPAANPGSALQEILLVNERGEIMEGSLTTPYFLRGGEWITPSADCGGHLGTTRRWSLEKGLCKEGVILTKDVQWGEHVVLSNGVRGYGRGIVQGSIIGKDES